MQSAQRKTNYDHAPAPARKRNVKMRGNVAYINNDFLSTQPMQRPKPQPKRGAKAYPGARMQPTVLVAQLKNALQQKTQEALQPERSHAPGRGLASTIFVLFVAFCALALLVSRHASIASIGVKNNALHNSIAAIEAQIEDLELELELRSTLEDVQNTARQELGMTYPVQNDKIFIDLNGR